MSSPMYGSMSGVMSGLPQGGVRPFQPSRGPMGNPFTAVPYGGDVCKVCVCNRMLAFGNRERFAPQPLPMPRGGMMMGNPFQGMGFGMGAQPQPPQVSPQPITPMTPTLWAHLVHNNTGPARVMTEDERRMVPEDQLMTLTTANPFLLVRTP